MKFQEPQKREYYMPHHSPQKDSILKKTVRKYLAIIIYCSLLFCFSAFNNPLAPISKTIKSIYGISVEQIYLATSIYWIASLVFGLPSNFIIQNLGLRTSAIIASMLLTTGIGCHLLFQYNIYFVHLGSLITGLGSPLITNGIAIFTEHWFRGPRSVKINF